MDDDDLLPWTYVHIIYSGCTAAVLLRGQKRAIWALNVIIAPLPYTSTEAVCKKSGFYCVESIYIQFVRFHRLNSAHNIQITASIVFLINIVSHLKACSILG